jgi:hypothetical protein
MAVSGKGPKAFAWLHLGEPLPGHGPLHRGLRQRYVLVLRQFVYSDGQASMLIMGNPQELASIARLHAAGNFHPDIVLGVWSGALPIPDPILAMHPMGGDRHVQIIGLDPDASPKDELLIEVSHDAQVNLAMVRREPAALGVFFLLAGKGRPEAVEALAELHNQKLLPSAERSNVILSILSDDIANPPGSGRYRDSLTLDFMNSRADQLRGFYGGIIGVLPADHAIRGDNLPPEPGSNINARVELYMPKRPQEVRERLEQHTRNVGGKLGMKAQVSWMINGVMIARPDLE